MTKWRAGLGSILCRVVFTRSRETGNAISHSKVGWIFSSVEKVGQGDPQVSRERISNPQEVMTGKTLLGFFPSVLFQSAEMGQLEFLGSILAGNPTNGRGGA
eukprot:456055-Ditylum_brightwellii.AAC.1